MPKKESGTTQVYNPKTKRYVERGADGKFVDVKEEPNEKFKNVPVEK